MGYQKMLYRANNRRAKRTVLNNIGGRWIGTE